MKMKQENHSQQRIEPREFIKGDCIEVLKERKDIQPELIITDPPYNVGWKYSDKVNDNKKDYHTWCVEWAELCFKRLREGGVFCIINYPENNNILYTRLVEKGYNFIQQLIWNYPTNIGHSKFKYTRTYRTILVFSKGKPKTFIPIKQPYKNPTDKRIKKRIAEGHKGVNHYDVFTINLCKNVSKSKKNNGINQLPDELIKMLISTYSDYHDTVLDPFVGNGTVTRLAWDMGRGAIGIDINNYELQKSNKGGNSEV